MPIVLCVLGMVLVGSSISVSQLLLDFPLLTGQGMRYAAAAVMLFAIARLFPRFGAGSSTAAPNPRELAVLTALAATGMAAFNVCIMIGLRHADPAVVGTVVGAAPLGLALLGPLLRGARPTARLLVAAAVVAGEAAGMRLPTSTELGALAYLAVLMTVVAFVVWFVGLQRLGVERAGMIVGVMPIATLATAAIMAGALPGVGPTLGVL